MLFRSGSWYDKMFCASLDTIQEAFDYSCRELRSKKCTIIIRLNAKEALADELSDIVLFIESVSMLFSNPKNKQRQGESDFPAWHVEMQVGKTEEDGCQLPRGQQTTNDFGRSPPALTTIPSSSAARRKSRVPRAVEALSRSNIPIMSSVGTETLLPR